MHIHLHMANKKREMSEHIDIRNTNKDFHGVNDMQDNPYTLELFNECGGCVAYLSKAELERVIFLASSLLQDEDRRIIEEKLK